MKKFVAIFTVMVCALFTLSAQPQQARQPRPEANREQDGNFTEFQIQVLTKQLRLDEKSVEPFTKLYTEYSQKMEQLQPEQPEQRRNTPQNTPQNAKQGERPAKPTDAEVEAKILESFEMAEKSTALKREYYTKFKEILNPHQILKMYNIERRLRERIVSESDRRANQRE
ncbi:MAG: hypothetical protein SNH35_00480 [Rikenellaceae bacterium]